MEELQLEHEVQQEIQRRQELEDRKERKKALLDQIRLSHLKRLRVNVEMSDTDRLLNRELLQAIEKERQQLRETIAC